MNKRKIVIATAVSAVLAAGSVTLGATAFAAPAAPALIKACAKAKSGAIRVVPANTKKCNQGEQLLTWNAAGATGATGAAGAAGAGGSAGAAGLAGAAGAAGAAGSAGHNGQESYSGDLQFNLVSNNTWHDVATFQLKTGDWTMSYQFADTGVVVPVSGTWGCKITIDGDAVPLSATDMNIVQYGDEHRVVTNSTMVVACRNNLADAGGPVTLPMDLWVSQESFGRQLVGTVL